MPCGREEWVQGCGRGGLAGGIPEKRCRAPRDLAGLPSAVSGCCFPPSAVLSVLLTRCQGQAQAGCAPPCPQWLGLRSRQGASCVEPERAVCRGLSFDVRAAWLCLPNGDCGPAVGSRPRPPASACSWDLGAGMAFPPSGRFLGREMKLFLILSKQSPVS